MIGGLQKVTLLDYPGKVACTVFFTGCNLRCPYCHNPELVLPQNPADGLASEFLFGFLASRTGKLDGVCITGGEPTLHPELPGIIRRIRAMGFLVKLDSNGTVPEMLEALLQENLLDYVAMDIKNAPDCYAETCGAAVIEKVRKSAALYRLRVPHNGMSPVSHAGTHGSHRPLAPRCKAVLHPAFCRFRQPARQRRVGTDKTGAGRAAGRSEALYPCRKAARRVNR